MWHAAAGNPAFEYEFVHVPPERAALGATHASELSHVFGTYAQGLVGVGPPARATEADARLSDVMQRYWTNFAKTGDPNGPGLPKWPKFDAKVSRLRRVRDVRRNGEAGAPPSVLRSVHRERAARDREVSYFRFEALATTGVSMRRRPTRIAGSARPRLSDHRSRTPCSSVAGVRPSNSKCCTARLASSPVWTIAQGRPGSARSIADTAPLGSTVICRIASQLRRSSGVAARRRLAASVSV